MASSNPERLAFHGRLRQIRRQVYGEQGIPVLAEALEIPEGTWENFEAGVTIPTPIIIQFLALTGIDLHWLLTSDGEPNSGDSTGQHSTR